MREIACPSCKYGVTEIVESSPQFLTLPDFRKPGTFKRTDISRRCTSCGASLHTYKCEEVVPPISNMPPPSPPVMPDIVGELRDDRGRLLWNPEGIDP